LGASGEFEFSDSLGVWEPAGIAIKITHPPPFQGGRPVVAGARGGLMNNAIMKMCRM